MKTTDFAQQVTVFLSQYLPAQRHASPNTVKAYRDVHRDRVPCAALLVVRRNHPHIVTKFAHNLFEQTEARRVDAVVVGNQDAVVRKFAACGHRFPS